VGTAFTVKVDRSAPTVTPSGSLWDARTGFIRPGQDYSLAVNAADGDASSAGTQRSGATNIEVTVDGQAVAGGSSAQPCAAPAGSCPLSLTVPFTAAQLAGYGAGPHTVSITATDALGNNSAPTTVFGNANPGKGKKGIYGWLPERANTTQPARSCPRQAP
jgi:hypothetical protein